MWNKIRDQTIEDLHKLVPEDKRLIITGISLGGGLAAISYIDIKFQGFRDVEVITWGAPRVGNKKWANWFDTLTDSTRVYIRRDPIAFLPICLTPICNYRQTGNPIVCYPKKELCKSKKTCKKSFEDEDDYKNNFEIIEDLKTLNREIQEHKDELREGELEGLLDHIYGYPKVMDYDVCM